MYRMKNAQDRHKKYFFTSFKEEVGRRAVVSSVGLLENNNDTKIYEVGPSGDLHVKKKALFHKKTKKLVCARQMFEWEEISCMHRHTFLFNNFKFMPKEYILKRWCMDVKKDKKFRKWEIHQHNGGEQLPIRSYDVQYMWNQFLELLVVSSDHYQMAKDVIYDGLEKLKKNEGH